MNFPIILAVLSVHVDLLKGLFHSLYTPYKYIHNSCVQNVFSAIYRFCKPIWKFYC